MTIEWTPDFSVGVEKFDEQHKRLFSMANQFLDSYKTKDLDQIKKVINALRGYTVSHFDDEEEAMKAHDYPNLSDHLKEHEDFKRYVVELYDEVNSGKTDNLAERTSYFFKWLSEHIGGTDKKYGEFFRSLDIEIK